ncbi:hypothetical protein K402DRAFT_215405 [Aulographum hederae CBS 113979]|uniref:Uncharacterized protein n=1 Tax=Aulographum hederae CBS 113979 TaxID=1176131 RepID=A0A6G1GMJ4_9PEZI|nr:hypothetical protein K402DRAFT_215405 [Aulographum hederae CBS 113979]
MTAIFILLRWHATPHRDIYRKENHSAKLPAIEFQTENRLDFESAHRSDLISANLQSAQTVVVEMQAAGKEWSSKSFKKIIDHVNNAINSGRGSLQDHPAGMAILAQLEPAQQMIQALAREEQGRENVKGGKSDLGLIMMKLDRIEKTVSVKVLTPVAESQVEL